jgi:hypothetical protein
MKNLTLKEIENLISLANKQIELMRLFEKELIQQFGRMDYEERLNRALDKYNYYINLRKKFFNGKKDI